MLDALKDAILQDSFSILVMTPIDKLQDNIAAVLKNFSDRDMKGVYVSLSKPCDSLKRKFEHAGLETNNVFFIDCISKSIDGIERKDNTFYVSNAGDLDDIGISITEILQENKIDFLLIDSLETLLIYNKVNTIAIFAESVIRKSNKFKLKTVIMTSSSDKTLIDEIATFFDNIIGVEE
jgi:hypothetical protein